MAVTKAARMRWWPSVLAWALWLASLLCLAVVPWLDELLRQAGRADLIQFVFPDVAIPVLALVSAATVGAVVAARRPAHPVGWLLLGIALSLTGTAATAQYFVYGLLVRPGALPAARYAVLYQPATTFTALTLIGFVLLLTPTGALPSPRWRWPARVMAATPAVLVLVVTLAGGPVDPRYQALGGPFDLRGLDGVLLAANRTALAVTVVGLGAAAASLVGRFRHARGVERLQLRWVALAAVLVGLGAAGVLFSLAVGGSAAGTLFALGVGCCLVVPPVVTGAAVLRYRLYDLDRIFSRTLSYGLLTLLLGGGYALVVLGLGQLLGRDSSSLVVAAATLAVAAAFQPARRRIQRLVDRRFNRRRYDAARTVDAFAARLREQVDLDALSAELLAVVDQTMQPTMASLWLRRNRRQERLRPSWPGNAPDDPTGANGSPPSLGTCGAWSCLPRCVATRPGSDCRRRRRRPKAGQERGRVAWINRAKRTLRRGRTTP